MKEPDSIDQAQTDSIDRMRKINNFLSVCIKSSEGYLDTEATLEILLLLKETDTLEGRWRYALKSNNVDAKYYQLDAGNTVVSCFTDLSYDFETHLVCFFKKENGAFVLKSKRRFFHGNYPCCWNEEMEGFGKTGPLFYLETCGTGSCFCSGRRKYFTFDHDGDFASFFEVPVTWYYCLDGKEGGEDSFHASKVRFADSLLKVQYALTSVRMDSTGRKVKNYRSHFEIRYRIMKDTIVVENPERYRKEFSNIMMFYME